MSPSRMRRHEFHHATHRRADLGVPGGCGGCGGGGGCPQLVPRHGLGRVQEDDGPDPRDDETIGATDAADSSARAQAGPHRGVDRRPRCGHVGWSRWHRVDQGCGRDPGNVVRPAAADAEDETGTGAPPQRVGRVAVDLGTQEDGVVSSDSGRLYGLPPGGRCHHGLRGQVDGRAAPNSDPVGGRCGVAGAVDHGNGGLLGGGVDHPDLEMVPPRASAVPEVLALAGLPVKARRNPPDVHTPDLVQGVAGSFGVASRFAGGAVLRHHDRAGGQNDGQCRGDGDDRWQSPVPVGAGDEGGIRHPHPSQPPPAMSRDEVAGGAVTCKEPSGGSSVDIRA